MLKFKLDQFGPMFVAESDAHALMIMRRSENQGTYSFLRPKGDVDYGVTGSWDVTNGVLCLFEDTGTLHPLTPMESDAVSLAMQRYKRFGVVDFVRLA